MATCGARPRWRGVPRRSRGRGGAASRGAGRRVRAPVSGARTLPSRPHARRWADEARQSPPSRLLGLLAAPRSPARARRSERRLARVRERGPLRLRDRGSLARRRVRSHGGAEATWRADRARPRGSGRRDRSARARGVGGRRRHGCAIHARAAGVRRSNVVAASLVGSSAALQRTARTPMITG